MTEPAARVLVVHDSPTVRASLRRTIESAPDLRVVGELTSGQGIVEALERLAPDVIVMDVVMPDVDGWRATREVMALRPTPIVLVSQVVDPGDASVALAAIRAGALAIVDPPPAPDDVARSHRREHFLSVLRAASRAQPLRGLFPERRPASPTRRRRPARALGVVASAGGPPALQALLADLPKRRFPPMLVVQHMARGFVDGLARLLSESGHPVSVARDGEPAAPGHVYLAPDNRHLGLRPDLELRLTDEPSLGGFRPSATRMLRSMAEALGPDAAAVVLTGMGDDGAEGALAVHRAGGEVVAQDEASSVVFGMPQAAIARGAVDEVLPLARIPGWILEKTA